MGLLLTIILGALAGWLASIITNREAEQGALMNIVVGVAGAMLANWILAPIFGAEATLSSISLSGFLMSLAGSVLLLVIVNLITRKSVR